MSTFSDLAANSVNAAAEANFLVFAREWKRMPGAEYYEGDDLIRVMMPSVPHPLVNMVTRTRLVADVDHRIAEILGAFAEQQIPFLWQVEPSSQPGDLGERLVRQGLQALEKNEVLVADLNAVAELPAAPEGFEIRPVLDEKELETFGLVLRAGFELPQAVLDVFLSVLRANDVANTMVNYIGYLQGEPVSAGTTLYAGGVAGFYNGTVLEAARGLGIGTANALHRVQAAKERGYRVGFMISGGNAYNMYRRLGFTEYAPWYRYLWMPPE